MHRPSEVVIRCVEEACQTLILAINGDKCRYHQRVPGKKPMGFAAEPFPKEWGL